MDNVDRAVEDVGKEIDRLGDPNRMTKKEWVEFLKGIIGDCEAKKEAAEQELEAEGEEG